MTLSVRPRARRGFLVNLIWPLLFPLLLGASETRTDENWLEDDSDWNASQVNEGRLQFIAPMPGQSVLSSDTQLWLTENSLRNGWVDMQQCYRNLDAVSRTEVVYAYRDMKNLQVTRVDKVARSRVTARGVELQDVEKGARVCVRAEVKVLRRLTERTFAMQHGPYHRRFLDGYYPYHLSLTVHYPNREMRLERVEPEAQTGFELIENDDSLIIESWFEGELTIVLEFSKN
ncbi:MAG: hypothetical protein JSU67_01935 [Gammaproteobacteria bacterium]|nr:MAG: hypothetical protein EP300_04815 [Gammaproteobacteria bacterium]UCH40488.1 MAG: hypothetical protein JSU67_01935 [Gammaproteobacteria bacterium]